MGLGDILVVNELEAETLSKKKIDDFEDARRSMEILLDRCQNTVITLGEKGLLIGEGSQMNHIPAHTVSTVSTLGAGDAFVGVMAANFVRRQILKKVPKLQIMLPQQVLRDGEHKHLI